MTFRFFLMAFAIGWGALLPFALLPRDLTGLLPWLLPLLVVARFAPSLAGLTAAGMAGGESAARELLGRLVPRFRDVRWLATAAAVPLLASLIATEWTVAGGTPIGPTEPHALLALLPGIARALLLGGGLGEELGWRGFALPRLQRSMHPLAATLLLGVVGAVWHWPAFRLAFGEHRGDSFPMFLLSASSLSVLFTWVYNRSGSLLPCALLHAAVTACPEAFARAVPLLWTNGVIDGSLAAVHGMIALFLIASTRGRLGAGEGGPER